MCVVDDDSFIIITIDYYLLILLLIITVGLVIIIVIMIVIINKSIYAKQNQLDFQTNVDAVWVNEWSDHWLQKWKIPFNVTKCHAMAFFNSQDVLPSYMLNTTNIIWVEEPRYLGVTLQQDLNFDKRIPDKTSRILRDIMHALRTAPVVSLCQLL